jgi:hypothetical protein
MKIVRQTTAELVILLPATNQRVGGVFALTAGGLVLLLALGVGRAMLRAAALSPNGHPPWGGLAFLAFFGLMFVMIGWLSLRGAQDVTFTFSGPSGRLVMQAGRRRQMVRLADIVAARVQDGGNLSLPGNPQNTFGVSLTLRHSPNEMSVSQSSNSYRRDAEALAETINQFLDSHRPAT